MRFLFGSSPPVNREDRVELSDGQTIKAERVVLGRVTYYHATSLFGQTGIPKHVTDAKNRVRNPLSLVFLVYQVLDPHLSPAA